MGSPGTRGAPPQRRCSPRERARRTPAAAAAAGGDSWAAGRKEEPWWSRAARGRRPRRSRTEARRGEGPGGRWRWRPWLLQHWYIFFTGYWGKSRKKEDWARPREDLEKHQLASLMYDVSPPEQRQPHLLPKVFFLLQTRVFFFKKSNGIMPYNPSFVNYNMFEIFQYGLQTD